MQRAEPGDAWLADTTSEQQQPGGALWVRSGWPLDPQCQDVVRCCDRGVKASRSSVVRLRVTRLRLNATVVHVAEGVQAHDDRTSATAAHNASGRSGRGVQGTAASAVAPSRAAP